MEMCLLCGSSGGLGHPLRLQASKAVEIWSRDSDVLDRGKQTGLFLLQEDG